MKQIIFFFFMIILMMSMNPLILSLSLLGISIIMSFYILKISMSVWTPCIVILIFSSGMMTMLIYASSSNPSEHQNMKNFSHKVFTMGILCFLSGSMYFKEMNMLESMKKFSSSPLVLMMTLILLLCLISMSEVGFTPKMNTQSSF